MNESEFVHGRPASEPIHLSGVWQMDSPAQADAVLGGAACGFVYRRDGHPNAASLQQTLARLHRADEAIVTAQGMSALSAVFLSILQPDDLVLLGQPLYGKTSVLIKSELSRWGVRWMDVPVLDPDEWKKAIRNQPRMVVVETISNPRMDVPDLDFISQCIRQSNSQLPLEQHAQLLVDNTFATPSLCKPISHGADWVMESLSKFVCGHGDVMLGLLCGKKELFSRVRGVVSAFGLASSPLDCWLTNRGLATLDVRMARASETALELAQRLVREPMVSCVDYPGLESHRSFHHARKILSGGFGNMLSFRLAGGGKHADAFIRSVRDTVPFFPSLGDQQTSLSHPVSTSHRSYSPSQLEELGIDAGTIRLSVGLEPASDLWPSIESSLHSTASR